MHELTPAHAAQLIAHELRLGDEDFALRLVITAVSDFERAAARGDDLTGFLAEPATTGDERWDALLAASIGRRCRQFGIERPRWTFPAPLASFWFPVFTPAMAAYVVQRTAADLAAIGIWLDESAFSTA
jgi:hypothetical protein